MELWLRSQAPARDAQPTVPRRIPSLCGFGLWKSGFGLLFYMVPPHGTLANILHGSILLGRSATNVSPHQLLSDAAPRV